MAVIPAVRVVFGAVVNTYYIIYYANCKRGFVISVFFKPLPAVGNTHLSRAVRHKLRHEVGVAGNVARNDKPIVVDV